MRDRLFQYYVFLGHELCCLKHYSIRARRIDNIYSGFLMVVSAGSIVTLAFWQQHPLLWSILALVAQMLQILKPLTQASRQRQALKYIVQDAQTMFHEVCLYWDTVGAYDPPRESDQVIAEKIAQFKHCYEAMFDRFAGDLDFPESKYVEKKARQDNAKYFSYYYDVKPEEVS